MGKKAYIHSCYCRTNSTDAVIVSSRDVDTGKPELRIINRPKRKFWITKPGLRTHAFKKEFAPMHELDMYMCDNFNLANSISMALYGRPSRSPNPRNLFASPYVYGANIDIATLVKMKYHEKYGKNLIEPIIGAIDTEIGVPNTPLKDRILCCTHGYQRKLYCSVYKPFLQGHSYAEMMEVINAKIGKDYLEKFGYELVVHVFEREIDLIKWHFSIIHKDKPDFIGIWNMPFDIHQFFNRIEANGENPADIFIHPDVPEEFKQMQYFEDHSELDHFTDRWDWFSCPGYTQFYDAMCLYSRLRKVKGRLPFYGLDFIAKKELGKGKIEFEDQADHHEMQTKHPLEYIAYNIGDVIPMLLMEENNHDVPNMMGLVGDSRLSDFSRQTGMLRDAFYKYCLNKNLVSAAVGKSLMTEFDKVQAAVGGAVLDPTKAIGTGVPIFTESDMHTLLHFLACDIDVSSMYPSGVIALNISKETKYCTCIDIEGYPYVKELNKKDKKYYMVCDMSAVERLFSGFISPDVNGVETCHEFLNLPHFNDMTYLYNEELKKIQQQSL